MWWRWTAPAAGQVTLATTGSDFDTLLAVYTGNTLATLAPANSNNDPSAGDSAAGLVFQAQSGTTYQWAVDGAGGASGHVVLQWSLNTTAKADVAASLSGPTQAAAGEAALYTLGLANAGPQAATHAQAQLTLPAGTSLAATPSGCSVVGAVLTCSALQVASGQSHHWTMTVNVATASGFTLAANATSDLPDPATANNAVSLVVTAGVGGDTSADVPAVPPWGLVLMAGLMGLAMMRNGATRVRLR